MTALSLLALSVLVAGTCSAAPLAPTVEIAPGVEMPMINLGTMSNHTTWIASGGRGLDTALVYGDAAQKELGAAVRAAVAGGTVARKDLFVTTKVPCCPAGAWFKAAGGGSMLCLLPGSHNTTKQVEHDFKVRGYIRPLCSTVYSARARACVCVRVRV